MKKKKRVLPPLKSNPIVKLQEPIDMIIITGYVVVDNVAVYTAKVGSNTEPKKLSYSELCIAESLHKVPTVCEIEERKL